MTNNLGVNIIGDVIQHVAAGQESLCEISAPGFTKENVDINILSPSKLPTSYRLKDDDGLFAITFVPHEVGTYSIDIYLSGHKIPECPLLYKVYDSSLIRVSDIRNGVVAQPSQFRVDASQAGEGQLEISINDGEVPNHVQVLGGGRCLVHFTPEVPKPHTIDIKFNGEPVPGCPFLCQMADTSKVSVALHHLELMPVNKKASFQIHVDTTDNAELAVSVTGPRKDIPVQVTGNVKDGFVAQFLPDEVGPYVIGVEYNNVPVGGTPFTGKAYDWNNVIVSPIPWGTIGKSLEFTVDASRAGEGNLEITISARGRNIPTQVHPQGAARFVVSFVPLEATDHLINITFNKDVVPGAPFMAKIHTDPNRILVSGQSLAATAVGKRSSFTLSNVTGEASDLDIVIDSPNGEAIPADIEDKGSGNFGVEFTPVVAGEHQIYLSFASEPIPGSPFACKVYNVEAIQVRACEKGIVGKPVTFLVETSRAGPGNLEVTVNNGQVPTSAQAQGNHTYAISFIPKESKPHIVELKFNGENVPGSPFKCAIVDAAKVNLSGEGLEKIPVHRQATFFIEGQFDMGDPEVKIMSPLKKVLSSSIRFIGEGHFAVDYTPTTVGDHQVEVKMGDIQVQGSPFVIKAYDVSKVTVSNISSGFVGKPVFFSIDASQAGAGNLEIIVSVNGKNVPNYVQSEGNAKFRVNFKPLEPLTHMLSVKFNNEFVPNSPFACEIQGNKVVSLHGAGVQLCPVGRPAIFSIDASSPSAKSGDQTEKKTPFDITVVSPNGHELPVEVKDRNDIIEVEYLPEEVGPHIIKISQDSIPVEGSPFTCNVYDVANILVAGLTKQCHMGRPCTFTVDASKAGEGTLELVVTTAKTSVRAEVQARSRGLYDVTFVPQELNPHFINITFNDEHIEQSPFECSILEQDYASNANENGQISVIRGRSAAIELPIDRAARVVALFDPHGNESQYETAQGTHGKTRILLKPSYVGKYTLETQPSGQVRDKILINVFDPSKIQVMKTGPAFVGEGSDFIVDTSNAGRGALSVNVKAAGQDIKHSIKDVGSGRFEVTFFPYLPIPHKIDVKFNGVSVARSLLEIKVKDPYQGKTVTASGMGLFAAKVNDDTSFIIDTMGYKSNDFDILVTGPPDGVPPFEAIPLRCYQQKDGKLLAEFCTTTVGPHKIEVLLSGQHIRGSPFECQSFDPETVHILDVEGKEQQQLTGQPITFKLDRRRSGLSDLDVVVTSPVGDDLPIEIKGLHHEPGVDLVEFKPEMAGKYRFIIQYGGTEIPNSPLTFNVRDMDAPVDFRAFGQGLQKGQVNHPCYFEIEQFNDDSLPRVDILHPSSGQPLKTNVEKTSPNSMRVTYVPDAIGSYLILVQHEGRAPLEYKANVFNPKRIQIIKGFDVKQAEFSPRLALQQEALVLFHLNEAGVGKLEAELILPNHVKAKVDVHQVKERAEIRFLPQEYGEYALSVKFNGILLPFCPMRGLLDGGEASKGSGKVKLTGTGLVSAICQEDNFFMIDGSRAAQGTPDVKLTDATNLPLPVRLRKVDADIYEARYSPTTPGDYMLNIKWAGHLIKGCPLNITASPGSASEQPASKVFCSGEGLRGGTLGKDIRSFIDTRKAGPGELSLHCVGPRGKTAYCELNDHQDGTFTLNLKPQEAGRHQLAIKYGGNHVKGSPFTVRVSGSPDPDKVKVYGPGIDHGVLAMYQSRFICDTRGAGAGQLTVRIRGPKGAFRVEMQRESQKDRTILCKYEPTEPGDYRIEVKWSGENVPGSPFVVMIFDTQEELSRLLQRGYSPTGYSSDMYGTAPYSGSQNYGVVPWAGGQ